MIPREQRVSYIESTLQEKLKPESLEIEDDSASHAGHASAGGGGHFNVYIVAEAFKGLTLIKRHRLVYDALKEAMSNNDIHALSIKALTPEETN